MFEIYRKSRKSLNSGKDLGSQLLSPLLSDEVSEQLGPLTTGNCKQQLSELLTPGPVFFVFYIP